MKRKWKLLCMALPLILGNICGCHKEGEHCPAILYTKYFNAVKGKLVYDPEEVRYMFYSLEEENPYAGYLTLRSGFYLQDYEYLYSDEEGYLDKVNEYLNLGECYADIFLTKGGCQSDTFYKPLDPHDSSNKYMVCGITHFYQEKKPKEYYSNPKYEPWLASRSKKTEKGD